MYDKPKDDLSEQISVVDSVVEQAEACLSLDACLPLEGEVCEQHIRCGKPGCHCREGQPHGPYFYRIWREGTRVRKVYVKATELEQVRAACEAHKLLSQRLREGKKCRVNLTKSIERQWRLSQRLTR